VLGLTADAAAFDRIVESYNELTPYPEAPAALAALRGYRLAILSNGSPDMLAALVRNSALNGALETVISVDAKRTFKPDPAAYELVQERLGMPPEEVVFVSSNGFDVAGAKRFGFRVARIERVTPAALTAELTGGPIGPAAMFKAQRSQIEALGYAPDVVIGSLTGLVDWVG
jgi:2-haloacid dehalogenase